MQIMEKPMVVEKLRRFYSNVRKNDGKIGTNLRILDYSYHNICNFKCQHCFTKAPDNKGGIESLSFEKIAEVADEAHELGIYEFDLQGGELLLFPDKMFKLIETIKPERFYVYLTTNGYYLDEEMALRLAAAGVDRVSVSIDSIDAREHDSFRGCVGAHEKAMKALEYVKAAGMAPHMNITVGHYNAFSKELEELLSYSKEHGYTTVMNIAIPTGCWLGNTEVMVDRRDKEHLLKLRKKYGNILRDIWDPFDRENEGILGCNTISRMYMTPVGDILACPFMQIKIGNINEQSLKEIVEYGYTVKKFHDYSDVCLVGEDREFVKKYMKEGMSIFNPLDAKEVFEKEDYI